MSLPIGSVVTDVTLESLSASNQSNVPFTFGQVFKVGDVLPSESITGRINGVEQPLQYEVKATHNDGSVRHAIISGVLPSLAAKAAPVMQLVKSASNSSATLASTPTTASISATVAGVKYNATVDNTLIANKVWLSGNVVQEKHFNLPLTKADGTAHPHLFARFALRDYGINVRVDISLENNWAYVDSPENFKANVEIIVGSKTVFSAADFVLYHHTRYRRIFWLNAPSNINVKLNIQYLMASKAVPNYNTDFPPNEDLLKSLAAKVAAVATDKMDVGLATAYMPTTGAHEDIGILPLWQAAYVLSMDSRARDASLVTGNCAGSYPIHYRDANTDRPVSLANYPSMTILGRFSDTWNQALNRMEAFPACAINGDCTTPYTPDTAHQPSLAYLPYLVTGDYYYLEEMQFWAMYDAFVSNPNYREKGKGLVIWDQLRGQAWSLRTLAQAAYITPDADELKKEILYVLSSNLEWYNKEYSNNPNANSLGVPIQGYSMHNNTQVAPWMHDFFTSAVGYAYGLGFSDAKPLLDWASKFTVGRMTAEGVCWITGAIYDLTVRDSADSPLYSTFSECYTRTLGKDFMTLPCASPEMAKQWGKAALYGGDIKPGDMANISSGTAGYPANMQPALAYAVNSGIPESGEAWKLFESRTVKPDYRFAPTFSIVPYEGAIETPIPEEPIMTFKVSVAYATAVQTLPAGTEAASNHTLVELLAADGTTVVASSSDSREFTGIKAGSYVVRVSGVDSKGAVMGVPATKAFTIEEEVIVPPVPTTVDVMLPSSITVSYVKE